jgi:hypothetical protein
MKAAAKADRAVSAGGTSGGSKKKSKKGKR